MPPVYAVLGFTALGLACPIPKHPPHTVAIPPYWPSTVGRGLIAAPTTFTASQASPRVISILNANTTTQSPAPSASPSQTSFKTLQQQSLWGPGDISNVIFGCVASGLGAIAVVLTYCLYRQQSSSQQSDESIELGDIPVFEPPDDDIPLPLEDLPPAYTSVEASADSLGQQGTPSPVTP